MIMWSKWSARETAAMTILLLGLTLAVARLTTGCSLFTSQNAKTALDVVQVACAIENAALGDRDIAVICGVADELLPELRTILAAHRKALAWDRVKATIPDAAPDPCK